MFKVGDMVRVIGVDYAPANSDMRGLIGRIGKIVSQPYGNLRVSLDGDIWFFNEKDIVPYMPTDEFIQRVKKLKLLIDNANSKTPNVSTDQRTVLTCLEHPEECKTADVMKTLNILYHKYKVLK